MFKKIIIGKFNIIFISIITVLLLSACGESNSSTEEDYPTKNVDFDVGFDAGSQSDTSARTITKYGEEHFDRSFDITNSPGSAGLTSYENIYDAEADGYNLMLGTATLITHDLLGDLAFDYDELTPIITFQTDPLVMFAAEDAPFDDAEELVDYAKDHPGDVSVATGAPGGLGNVLAEVFEERLDVDFKIVPYEGSGAEPVAQTAGGNAQVSVGGTSEGISHVKEGDVKVLGTTTDISEVIEDAPTFEELELDLGMVGNIRSVYGPPEMPEEIVDKLYDSFKEGTEEEGFDEYIEENGVTKEVLDGEETKELYKEQEEVMEPVLGEE